MRWIAGAAIVNGLASVVLLLNVGVHGSAALSLDGAFVAAAPSAFAALLLGIAAKGSRLRLACFGAGLLVLPCLLAAAWATLLCAVNDDKWTCVGAGVASGGDCIVVAITAGRLLFSRADG
jgi:hypothetical protein